MMIEVYVVLMLTSLHFIGDFLLQSDYMAINKGKSNIALAEHALMYILPFLLMSFPAVPLMFIGVNVVMHFIVDFFTSRLTAYLWAREERHWFFVVIGLDQLIHINILVVTYFYLVK